MSNKYNKKPEYNMALTYVFGTGVFGWVKYGESGYYPDYNIHLSDDTEEERERIIETINSRNGLSSEEAKAMQICSMREDLKKNPENWDVVYQSILKRLILHSKGMSEICIYINPKYDMVKYIFSGKKTIETRNTPSLRPYIGQRVGVIADGILAGFVTIKEEKIYNSEHQFTKDEPQHFIFTPQAVKEYGFNCKCKYGYVLENPKLLENLFELEKRKGNRVVRILSADEVDTLLHWEE